MISEYESEPIPGLPGLLPPGERILWQGSPDRRSLARTAFHTRLIAGYFVLLAALAIGNAIWSQATGIEALAGIGATVGLGAVCYGLLHLFAWASARSTIYTLTERRIVMRMGIALPKCINLPIGLVGSVDLNQHGDGTGDLPLTITKGQRLGYVALWPHARPWRLKDPQPMLRAVPDVATVATLIARTCLAAQPGGRTTAIASQEQTAPVADYGRAVAA